jgi:hypothetical protein
VCCFESDQEDPILSKSIWLGIVIRRGLLNNYANFMLDLSCKHSLLFFSFKITEAFTRSLAVWLTALRPFLYARPQLQLPGSGTRRLPKIKQGQRPGVILSLWFPSPAVMWIILLPFGERGPRGSNHNFSPIFPQTAGPVNQPDAFCMIPGTVILTAAAVLNISWLLGKTPIQPWTLSQLSWAQFQPGFLLEKTLL